MASEAVADLLDPMPDEEQADDQPQDEQSGVHDTFLMRG
jgi:hypothetical protein